MNKFFTQSIDNVCNEIETDPFAGVPPVKFNEDYISMSDEVSQYSPPVVTVYMESGIVKSSPLLGSSFKLMNVGLSMDSSKQTALVTVLSHIATMDNNEERLVPEYNRQQTVISEMSSDFMSSIDITDVSFPPVGAENLTKKRLSGVVWNAKGPFVTERAVTLAYMAQEIPECSEEAIAFSVSFGLEKRGFVWIKNRLRRFDGLNPTELRVGIEDVYSIFPDSCIPGVKSIPFIYTLFEPSKSYYVYIDGLPYYMPRAPAAILSVANGKACSNEGVEMFPCRARPGVYSFDLSNNAVQYVTARRPDSTQNISIVQSALVTTSVLLQRYPALGGPPCVIETFAPVDIIDKLDTRIMTCQIISEKEVTLDNRKRVFISQCHRRNFLSMLRSMAQVAVIVGNMRYMPCHGLISQDIGEYKGQRYVRYRTGEEIVVVKGMKPHHLNGTWYRLPSYVFSSDDEEFEDSDGSPLQVTQVRKRNRMIDLDDESSDARCLTNREKCTRELTNDLLESIMQRKDF